MKDREISSAILEIFTKGAEYTYNYKQIAAILGVKDPFVRKRIVRLLAQLEKDGQLLEISRGSIK